MKQDKRGRPESFVAGILYTPTSGEVEEEVQAGFGPLGAAILWKAYEATGESAALATKRQTMPNGP